MTYQRYMNGMSNGGSIRAQEGESLTNSELAAVVPSLFATEAHESRSDRFVPIPTVNVLDGLRAADFEPVFAQQARTRVAGKELFTRHMLRMRHKSLTNAAGRAFEIILTNANDGTSAYKMVAGIFRFVCLNGLFTGDAFAPVHVRHSGATAIDQVRDGALNILQLAPQALAMVDEMKGTHVTRDDANAYARAAHLLRFQDKYTEDENGNLTVDDWATPIAPVDLLRARRTADKHATAWHLFNIVQENALRGGQRGLIRGTNGRLRNAKVQPVKAIDGSAKLNANLWDLAEAMVKGKRATA